MSPDYDAPGSAEYAEGNGQRGRRTRPMTEPTPNTESELTGDGLSGRDVHRAWRDGMLAQGRSVASERLQWETLDQRDRDLDDGIAAALAALPNREAAQGEGLDAEYRSGFCVHGERATDQCEECGLGYIEYPPSSEVCRGKSDDRWLCDVHPGGYFTGPNGGGLRCSLAPNREAAPREGLDASEAAGREMVRERHRCIEPHGSLDDLLFGDATVQESREYIAERLAR